MSSVVRHSLVVRLTHWLVAISGIVLLFSGFGQMPMYKRYNIVKIPGLAWSSNYDITLLLHYLSAAGFGFAIAFHLLYHLRRGEFGLLPRRGDMRDAVRGVGAMIGLTEEPVSGKFQAKQRVIYIIFGSVSLVLLVTGLVKSYKNLGPIVIDPTILQWVAFTHTICGMLFLLLLCAHLAALLLKQHRPLIRSMITGKIDFHYARQHHPAWPIDE